MTTGGMWVAIQCNADCMVYSQKNLHFLLQNISCCEGAPARHVSPGLFVDMTSFMRLTHEPKVNAWFDAKVLICRAGCIVREAITQTGLSKIIGL